ncbi:endo alpha-1,4 polygalactosaminidase [Leucobacter chromiireducens]|uniref:endo alpha-1,4 polygalactosaminidase n=1 Tax=Leucobacter chromiireducens TaxID=283877 RepID=UPI000F63AD6D|nr:endo alpha-1,4 polygalactosaminidase [Leucobacter chromiireducens]
MGFRRALPAPLACGLAAVLLLAGCATGSGADAGSGTPSAQIQLPPAGGTPDYQLGGASEPAPGVTIVARDRSAAPAPGIYSICYVNGFQTQPGELADWPAETLLHDASGEAVRDPAWPDEVLLDTRTAATRAAIHERVAPWIEECAEAGYDAVEFDNLDTYTRSAGALSRADAVELAAAFVATAHAAGLAAGQKNAADDAELMRSQAGFDFAVTEECLAFAECGRFTEQYGDHVIDIEYTDELPRPFAEMCADPAAPRSLVLRDRDLTVPGSPEHVFETCQAR